MLAAGIYKKNLIGQAGCKKKGVNSSAVTKRKFVVGNWKEFAPRAKGQDSYFLGYGTYKSTNLGLKFF